VILRHALRQEPKGAIVGQAIPRRGRSNTRRNVIIATGDRYNPLPAIRDHIAQQQIGRADIWEKSSVQWCHGFAKREDSSSEPRHTRGMSNMNSSNNGIKVYRHAKFSYTNNLVQ